MTKYKWVYRSGPNIFFYKKAWNTKPLPHGTYETKWMNQWVTVPINPTVDKILKLEHAGYNWLTDEFDYFWTLRDKYKELNFVHKRGALLHGPAGGGKTSLLLNFSARLKGISLLCGSTDAASDLCKKIRKTNPDSPILVIFEDVDSIVSPHDEGEAGLLNFLDGAHQTDGVYAVATTNYIGELKDRLKNRPARFDVVLEIGMPAYETRFDYARQILPATAKVGPEQIAEATEGMSVAHVKEAIILTYIFNMPLEDVITRLNRAQQTAGFL